MVEDDADTRTIFVRWLVQSGYEVSETATGEGALEVLAREHFDLILLDLFLPGIGGMEVIRQVHGDPAKRDTQIVMASISDVDDSDTDAPSIEGWLVKPFSKSTLLETIEGLSR